ncbi:MAG: 50S ribosomal protein L24 [Burkholderiales bacterium]|nr:50S ribosomal protein L24 [Burkholderiales bacterium]
MKLKKGDNVIVISGKDKGKKGKIASVLVEKNRVIIEGINMMKKHQRPRKSGEKGTKMNIAMPIHASNVMVVDSKTGERSRVGKKKVGDKMIRVTKKSGQEI